MNIAIVDDIRDEAENVRELLREYAAVNRMEADISGSSSAEELLKSYRPLLYSVVFMDIYMNGMTGVEAAEHIRRLDASVIIIFLTTSEEHHADALHCHAYDYLLKPIDRKKLFRVMDDLMRLQTAAESSKLNFSSNRRDYSLPYDQIVYVKTESNGSNYLEIRDLADNSYRTRMTFSAVFDTLTQDNRFLPIQSGVLVNMEHIAFIKDKYCVMSNGERFALSVRKEKETERIWQNFMFDDIRKQSRRK